MLIALFLTCPYCGASDLINESDSVTIQRVKSRAYREVQLGQQQTEKDIEITKLKAELEKARIKSKGWSPSPSYIIMAVLFFGGFYLFVYLMSH